MKEHVHIADSQMWVPFLHRGPVAVLCVQGDDVRLECASVRIEVSGRRNRLASFSERKIRSVTPNLPGSDCSSLDRDEGGNGFYT